MNGIDYYIFWTIVSIFIIVLSVIEIERIIRAIRNNNPAK